MGYSYKDAGVDIKKGEKAVDEIKEIVKSTYNQNVITELGGFGGMYGLDLKKYNEPVLVAATDGVGTKLKLAFLTDKHDTIGIDLVAMCVNDLVTLGANPLFFLDYLATGELNIDQFKSVVTGIVEGCRKAGCALLGGETAEMPDFYKKGEYDTAGFAVGILDRSDVIDGSNIKEDDVLIGLKSNGVHSNGFSLVRKLFINQNNNSYDKDIVEELLQPTRIYVKSILSLKENFNIKGIAHITGGGLKENIPRILPDNKTAYIDTSNFDTPQIFNEIQKKGDITYEEMFRTFNMGIGMVLVVDKKIKNDVINNLNSLGETAYEIGVIKKGKQGIVLKGWSNV